jgi:hypothetical protein
MFKQSKWEKWYDAQPAHVKQWMDQPKPLWYDSDMWKAGIVGCMVGILFGLLF